MNPISMCAPLIFGLSLTFPVVGAEDPLVLPVWPGKVPGDDREIGVLNRVGIPAELHVYAKGEHGLGVRKKGQPTDAWTEACVAWLRGLGVLKPGRVPTAGGYHRMSGSFPFQAA